MAIFAFTVTGYLVALFMGNFYDFQRSDTAMLITRGLVLFLGVLMAIFVYNLSKVKIVEMR